MKFLYMFYSQQSLHISLNGVNKNSFCSEASTFIHSVHLHHTGATWNSYVKWIQCLSSVNLDQQVGQN